MFAEVLFQIQVKPLPVLLLVLQGIHSNLNAVFRRMLSKQFLVTKTQPLPKALSSHNTSTRSFSTAAN